MNEQPDFQQILLDLSETSGVPGHEFAISAKLESLFRQFSNDIYRDKLGNLIVHVAGEGEQPRPRILIATHMDEIGLIVTQIERGGFLRFTQLGGFDPRTLLGQEVLVHGRINCQGIIGSKPPHLSTAEEREKAIPMQDLFIDLGMPEEKVRATIRVGDVITIVRTGMRLQNGYIAGKSLDNRASVVALLVGLYEMKRLRIQADIYGVATVQEEVGLRGATLAAFGIDPDLGLAIDVAHALMPGVAPDLGLKLDGGAIIHQGPNIHRDIYKRLQDTAKEMNIPTQVRLLQGPTETDGNAIQIAREGIPTGVLSIPLRYMHTSVETICYRDLERVGKLLAHFVAAIDRPFVEGLSCYLKN